MIPTVTANVVTIIGIGGHDTGLPVTITGITGHDRPEYSLVPGLSLEAARSLGQRLEQNALVWSASDGIPQLILLR